MKLLILTPHPALQPYIMYYVYSEIGVPGEWTPINLATPTGTALGIVTEHDRMILKENNKSCAYELPFGGQPTHYRDAAIYDRNKIFFVLFKPCGPYQLLGINQNECLDAFTNLTDLLGSSVRLFREELTEQTEPLGIKSVVERYLLRYLSRQKKKEISKQLAHAIEQLELFNGQSNVIKNVCRQQGYSISRLERHTREIVGVGPKMFLRITRFNKTLQYIRQRHFQCNWAQTACEFGYFDQAHFIREFKSFYGETPGASSVDDHFLSDIAYPENLHVLNTRHSAAIVN